MRLNEIKNAEGSRTRKTRLGRGSSSGLGKTSGRGVKGAKARTSGQVYGFEGGQTPVHRRIPKRGFKNIFANDFAVVNVGRIQKAVDDKRLDAGAKITDEVLRSAGVVHKSRDGVRLLGEGQLTAKLEIEVAGASASARAAVEKAGGSIKTTFAKKITTNKKGEPGKRVQRRLKSREKRAARAGQ